MNSLILAALLALNPGYNNPGIAGEVVAIEAATSNATATVQLQTVSSLTTYTNATAEVVTYEPAWAVTCTNLFVNPVVRFPPDTLPITIGGVEQTGVAVSELPDGTYEVYSGQNPSIATMAGPPTYAFLESFYDDILFAGRAPVAGEWPCLELYPPPVYTTNVVGYLDYSAFVATNGVSIIVGDPVRFDMPITNTVVVATLPSVTYATTNDLASVTTSGHFGSVSTNAFLLGDAILVTGAAEGDSIKVLIK